jgi:L-alanine-DL-glutamate epimerase-like enolase superfamily enzyme
MPFFEFVPPDVAESRLRRELVDDEMTILPDGTLPRPIRPGIGVELNPEAVEEFSRAARAIG